MHQFRPEPFLIMLASLCGGGQKAHNAWQNIQLQKFIHRELRITDEAAKGLKLHYKPSTQRWAPIVRIGFSRRLGDDVGDDPEEEEDNREDGSVMQSNDGEMGKEAPLPKTSSPILNAIYGQHMISARAYQSALCRLFSLGEALAEIAQSTCSERTRSRNVIRCSAC
jgi:general transcription factor 3C polypeptide 3 (transcription factor C subunit 4)